MRDIEKSLKVELLLLCIERSQLRWFGHLLRMPPRRHPVDVFWACPTGKRPQVYPEHARGIISLGWCENALRSPKMSWRKWPGKRTYGCPYLPCCHSDPVSDKRWIMDGWHLFS